MFGRRSWRGVRLTEGKEGVWTMQRRRLAGFGEAGVHGRLRSRRTLGVVVTAPAGACQRCRFAELVGARPASGLFLGTLPDRLPPARILLCGMEIMASAFPQPGRGVQENNLTSDLVCKIRTLEDPSSGGFL